MPNQEKIKSQFIAIFKEQDKSNEIQTVVKNLKTYIEKRTNLISNLENKINQLKVKPKPTFHENLIYKKFLNSDNKFYEFLAINQYTQSLITSLNSINQIDNKKENSESKIKIFRFSLRNVYE
ncbi:Uncharacterised protein [Mycoplasma putrefaciens]|nr:Uncharacterised protein [Mycoplasma putrefaciens]